MAANAVIVHQIPGRIRMRISEKRGDDAYFSKLSEELAGIDTVCNVTTNAKTGSVVIEHFDGLHALVEKMHLHDLVIDIQQAQPEKHPVLALDSMEMKPLNIVSGRDLNPMFMIASLLAVIGVVQTVRGKILIPSVSAFWSALEAFRQSGKAQ